jgi:hypothetical protein
MKTRAVGSWELCIKIDSEWGDWFPTQLLTDSSDLGEVGTQVQSWEVMVACIAAWICPD